jgi:nanoRNase/pAp phosphatase (c-di-AMP/oligoRNAs hydrolase)
MFKSKLENILGFLKNKSVLITTHDTADLDGFSSAFAFLFFLKSFLKREDIVIYFSSVGNAAIEVLENVIKKFPDSKLNYLKDINPIDYDVIIILDTNNINQVIFPNKFDLSKGKIPYFFIDHHYLNKKDFLKGNISDLNLVDDDYSSSAELIYKIFQEKKIEIPIYLRFLLVIGILSDTGHLRFATNRTFGILSNLLLNDIDYQEVLIALERESNYSERIALIKGAQRVKLIKVDDWLIGVSHVGSFESRVATTLLRLGFDVAIVYSDKSGEYRISTRAEKEVCLKTGLHLGKLLEEVSSELDASGGGHDGAASLTIRNNYEVALNKVIGGIKSIISLEKED